ncbi:hypothetical protein [Mucilaginibacter gilvus]|uniref:Nucleotide-diphospho-sugar transferase domain-containing protein n=1 Tax=Mucilaginibacter gilvus TaxID=2305909 RepID=A0A444MUP4_9SPHI|nr:hypothetical protein [Mucilaginibacter gilvus]RWY57328.1 hypothetical protein EPL05_01990 [Mucilaginibacter gilvus]
MKLERIISFANRASELRFRAMVSSLRETGCLLPVWVIPYDDNLFDLPDNCTWWQMDEVENLIKTSALHPMKRKFQCFLTNNYHFVDADVIFLRNPEEVLANIDGFVSSCGHWHNPEHTYVPSTLLLYKQASTTWQKSIFNSGQFACDRALYDINTLTELIRNPLYKEALDSHDQISINLFVFLSGVKVTNVTLPPHNLESSWAGDYQEDGYDKYWTDEKKKPYLIHWAGYKIAVDKPIDKLFTKYLTEQEKQVFITDLADFEKSRAVPQLQKFYWLLRSVLLGKKQN